MARTTTKHTRGLAPRLLWRKQPGFAIKLIEASTDGQVLALGEGSRVHFLDANDGREIGIADLGREIPPEYQSGWSAPEGILVRLSDKRDKNINWLALLNYGTTKPVWVQPVRPFDHKAETHCVVSGNHVFVANGNRVRRMSLKDGTASMDIEVSPESVFPEVKKEPSRAVQAILVDSDAVYAASNYLFSHGVVTKIRISDGKPLWAFVDPVSGGFNAIGALAVAPNGSILAATCAHVPDRPLAPYSSTVTWTKPYLYAIDAKTGKPAWRRAITDSTGDPMWNRLVIRAFDGACQIIVHGKKVFCLGLSGSVRCIDPNGEVAWREFLPEATLCTNLVPYEDKLIGSESVFKESLPGVFMINQQDGKAAWKHDPPPKTSQQASRVVLRGQRFFVFHSPMTFPQRSPGDYHVLAFEIR